ncbi:hypothetical protein ISS07_03240 [Candidatus Woesearchaeota archaeon]|nr:hypothetical protein [Candidatus Woesearchaeota archaeon]
MGNKKHVLRNINSESSFKSIDGAEISSLLELADSFARMSDDSYYYHVTEERNDFGNWVRDLFQEHELADSLHRTDSRVEAQATVLKFLVDKLK